MTKKRWSVLGITIASLVVVGIVISCATSSTPTGTTYGSTSSTGDYASWTVSGSDLSVEWKRIDTSGDVDMTFTITATCGSADADFGYKTCTIASVACTDGVSVCSGGPSAGNTFDMLEQPGVAIWVHTGSGVSSQLHVGLVADGGGCSADVSGSYIYSRLDLNNGAKDLFGLYSTDSDFNTVDHADFGVDCSAGCGGALNGATKDLAYNTTDGGGTGAITLTGSTCSGGVRTRGAGGGNVRSMMTESGLFILDLPSGEGGLVSFKTSNAATLADMTGKDFVGISFPDNASPQLFKFTAGAIAGDDMSLGTVTMDDASTMTATLSKINSATGTAYSIPAAYTGSGNALLGSFGSMGLLASAGLFKISDGTDDNVFATIAKLNDKIVGFGTVYNLRTGVINNTGNFIFFEKP